MNLIVKCYHIFLQAQTDLKLTKIKFLPLTSSFQGFISGTHLYSLFSIPKLLNTLTLGKFEHPFQTWIHR